MRLHGVAIAITGDPKCTEVQRRVDVTCTTCVADEADRYQRHTLPGAYQTFKIKNIDSEDPDQLRAAFNCVAGAMRFAVKMQEATLLQEGLEYRPVSVVLGKDSRVKYVWGHEGKMDILHAFVLFATIKANEGQKRINAQFAQDLKKCFLDFGNFTILQNTNRTEQELQRGVYEGHESINEEVKNNWRRYSYTKFLSGLSLFRMFPERFLDFLIENAERLGASRADVYGTKYRCNWIPIPAPNPDYHRRKDLQMKAPLYGFIAWNPEIRQAAEEGFRARLKEVYAREVTGNICIRAASEPPARLFQDAVHPMILDQIDVARGVRTVEDVSYLDVPNIRQYYIKEMENSL